jgi:thioredoxin reductase (NADPH)
VEDHAEAFPTLEPADIQYLGELGSRRRVEAGEYLYREGDPTYDFYVVVSATVDIVMLAGGEERLIASQGPGRFLGELNMLTGQRVFVSARVVEPGEVIQVPRAGLRQLMAGRPQLADTVLAAFVARRSILLAGAASAIRVIGSRFSHETRQVREFLARSRIPHEWIDPESDAGVEGLLTSFGLTPSELPVVVVSGSVLRRATPGDLAEYLGLTVESLPDRCFDLVVVGGGPAGLAASVYGASEGLRTLGVESLVFGGQAGTSSRIENYLGFPMGISGGDLTARAFVQAERFGARLTSPCTATAISERSGHLVVRLSDGTEVAGRAVIVATGARYRRLDVARLEEFEDSSVYYAATDLEARSYDGVPVVVAGGGNSAGQAALFLAASGSGVTIVIRRPDLAESMSRYLIERIEVDPRITVRPNATIVELHGDDSLSSLTLSTPDGSTKLSCSALFSFIGAEPGSHWLDGCAALDERGFVLTDRALTGDHLDERWTSLNRPPLPYETSHPGLFAVGDVRSGSTKRVATAVGEGSGAVGSVHQYLAFDH